MRNRQKGGFRSSATKAKIQKNEEPKSKRIARCARRTLSRSPFLFSELARSCHNKKKEKKKKEEKKKKKKKRKTKNTNISIA
jgi:hypothetical protein